MLKHFLYCAWLLVVLPSCGTDVSIPERFTPPATNTPWSTVIVTGSVVNLRAGPGTQYERVGSVYRGDTLQVTGGYEDWYRIYFPAGSQFAWIYGNLTSGTELP